MLGDYLDVYSFNFLMDRALSNIPDTVDKRQGSIIYDALAPACMELAEFYMQLKHILINTYISTASGQYLEYRVGEQGLTREGATYAIKKGVFTTSDGAPAAVPLRSRFSTISNDSGIIYSVLAPYTENGVVIAGAYQLKCETMGTIGNDYAGNLLPISNIQNLGSAIMTDLLTPAQDEETDDQLRARYYETINEQSFGGNIAQYDEWLKGIEGIGDAQIYPIWNGGGTVKCSIVDTEYNAVSTPLLNTVQNLIDPQSQGLGLGQAPIGHKVTITTPAVVTLNVSATISISGGYALGTLSPLIEQAIETYLAELRSQWGVPLPTGEYSLGVYVSKIAAAILSVQGVANVTNTTLNGGTQDIILTQDANQQQIPKLGTVTLNV